MRRGSKSVIVVGPFVLVVVVFVVVVVIIVVVVLVGAAAFGAVVGVAAEGAEVAAGVAATTVVGSVTSTTTSPSSPIDAVKTIVRSPFTKSTRSERRSACVSVEIQPGSATTWSSASPLVVVITHTVPVPAMSYCWAALAAGSLASVVDGAVSTVTIV